MTHSPAPKSAPVDVDVAIIGGGPAGTSAAIALGRSRRRVVVVDAGEPRNAPSAHAHNVYARDGATPAELRRDSRVQAERYGVRFVEGRAVRATRLGNETIELTTATGDVLRARRVLLATGVRDVLPEIPGLAAHWGDTVVHCPYCHGWEVRGRPIVVIGTSAHSARQALMFHQLSDTVTYVRHDAAPDDEIEAALSAVRVSIVAARVARVLDDARGEIRAVELEAGTEIEARAVAVSTTLDAPTELFEQLGGTPQLVDGVGRFIPADETGRTPVAGVWAVGNASNPMAMVGLAAASGTMAGAQLNFDLLLADARLPFESRADTAAGT